ncbi:hypothetical protein ABFV83_13810 [Lacrimispora sp. BS-2]|uniref:Uncharacterized protein n=1 Tax=Lacrimispora sp. BS-2 TaxID=3151850 RepID=A0AAU7PKQ6_9FIRM
MVQKIRINTLCETLLKDWCEKLLTLQITCSDDKGLYGGILCPACAGRLFQNYRGYRIRIQGCTVFRNPSACVLA